MKFHLIALPFVVFLSCNNSTPQKNTDVNTISHNSEKSNCLLDYATRYDQLLTVNEAASIIGRVSSEADIKYNKVMRNTQYHEVVYSWQTDRTILVQGVVIPDHDRVSISGIGKKSREDFKRDYSRRTEEEIAALNEQINQQLDKEFDKKSSSEKIEASKKRMNEMGISNETGKTTAKNIGGTLSSSLIAYEEVHDLGDAAAWNTKDKNLYVLNKDVQFCVGINMGDDDATNKKAAINAAKIIINKCN